MRIITITIISLLALSIAGCKSTTKKYDRQLPPGQLALRKITDPAQMPDLTKACSTIYDRQAMLDSIDNSIKYLSIKSTEKFYPYGDVTHEQMKQSLETFKDLLSNSTSPAQLKSALKEQFDVYISVGCDDLGTVLYTGYYTPILDGSYKPDGRFRYPLYKRPADLIKTDDGEILGQKLPDGSIAKYPSRQQIESSGMLNGTELVYLTDPFEVYVAHIQGSAMVKLPDGQIITVAYDGCNGHEYNSIRAELIKDGKIAAETASMITIMDHFNRNPQDVARYVQRNPRFVFFYETTGTPHGCLNVPVTPNRTVATDKTIFPRAGITVIDTTIPRAYGSDIVQRPYQGFAMDQDSGGAIRAPGRCDIYMGSGPIAGQTAGQTCQEGKLYYLILKKQYLK
ncbi:MAG: MltA domain-containing protein [Phycisphaerae bacterium]|nr:MltA domain-containing protein [Phycisphaerae bacterium]